MTYLRLVIAFFKNLKLALFLQLLTLTVVTLLLTVFFSLPEILRIQNGPGAEWAPDLALVIDPTQNALVNERINHYLSQQPASLQLSGRLVHLPKQTFLLGKNASFPVTLNIREVLQPNIVLPLKMADASNLACKLVSLKGNRTDWQLEVENCPINNQSISLDTIIPKLYQLDENLWQLTFVEETFTKKQRRAFYQRLLNELQTSLPLKHSGIGFDLNAATVNATAESTDLLVWQKALEASYTLAYPSFFSQQLLIDHNTSTDLNGRFNNYLTVSWLNSDTSPSPLKSWIFRPLLDVNASTTKQPQFWTGYSWAGSEALELLIEEAKQQRLDAEIYYYQHLWWPNAKIPNQLLDELNQLPKVYAWKKAELDNRSGLNSGLSWSLLPSGITYLFAFLIVLAGVFNFHQRNLEALGFLRLQGQSLGLYTPLFFITLLIALALSYFIWASWNVFFQQELGWFHHPVYNLPLNAYLSALGLTLLLIIPLVLADQLLLWKSEKNAISGVNDHA